MQLDNYLNTTNTTEFLQNDHYLMLIDYSIRVVATLIHVFYFLIVFKSNELKKRTYIFLHHVNLVSLIYCIHYTCYIGNRYPNFSQIWLNHLLCTLSELLWMNLKLMRMYSIILLAIYRYIGVYKNSLFKEINKKSKYIYFLIALTWLISIILTLILKFSLQTTYSIWFCTNGNSQSILNSFLYFSLIVTLGNVLPTFISICRYIRRFQIIKKQPNENSNRSLSNIKKQKSIKYAKQFLILNLISFFVSLISSFLNLQIVFASFENYSFLNLSLDFLKPILRSLFLILQSFIPILTIYFLTFKFNFYYKKFFF
jgi:hypothetical protein